MDSKIMIIVCSKWGWLSGNTIILMKDDLYKAGGIHTKLPEQTLPTIIFNLTYKSCH